MLIETPHEDLELRELTPRDARAYHELVQRNATHLTRLGDYQDEVAASVQDLATALAAPTERATRFGIYFKNTLIGRIDLVPVDPPRYGLGYWLSETHTGRGLATTAVAALLAYAHLDLNATDIFAGVTHGNHPSEALLTRLNFTRVAEFATYDRYHLELQAPVNPAPTSTPRPGGQR